MDLESFTLEYIKNKKLKWLENRVYDWLLVVKPFIGYIIEGKKVLILTDYKRKWFSEYAISKINSFQDNKPSFIPLFDLLKLIPQIEYATNERHFEMIEDMISISFDDEYIFWYVGVESDYTILTESKKDESFFWIFDKEVYKNFYLKSLDDYLDVKLVNLVDLLNETLKAAIFGDIELE